MPRGIGRAVFGQLVAPRRDAGDAMPGAALDAVLQRPLLAHGGGVQRQRARLGAGTKRGHAAIPCTAITAFMRAAARSGSLSRPAASASRNSSARCRADRVLCWPPTLDRKGVG